MPKTRAFEGEADRAGPETQAAIRKHSVKLSGHSTSLSLEGIYWDALREVAAEMGVSMNRLIEQIDQERSGNLSSAVRVFLFQYYRKQSRQRHGDSQDNAAQPPQTSQGKSQGTPG